jgi:hypothetical protein
MTNRYELGGSTRSRPSHIGRLDWSRVNGSLREFPNVAALIERGGRRSCRLGDCPIFLEWLHYGTPGYLLRVSAIEADLDLLNRAHVPGLDALRVRAASANRIDAFAMLAEIFVAAWFMRSGRELLAVHPDNNQGDLVFRDDSGVAYVEVYDLWAPEIHYSWGERWAELRTRLSDLNLAFHVEFHGVTDLHYETPPDGIWPVPVWADAPSLDDIDWICLQVLKVREKPRPFVLEGFSNKYPDLRIVLSDEPEGGVSGSWGSSGRNYPIQRTVDRILKKRPPKPPGHKGLLVEVSRFSGETFIINALLNGLTAEVQRRVRSWDAIVAFGRQWVQPRPAQVAVLHVNPGAELLVPDPTA